MTEPVSSEPVLDELDEAFLLTEEEEKELLAIAMNGVSLLPPDSESEEEPEKEPEQEPVQKYCIFCEGPCTDDYVTCQSCYGLLYMTYPEDFHDQHIVRCTNCGMVCDGSDYEHWNLCSRDCLLDMSTK